MSIIKYNVAFNSRRYYVLICHSVDIQNLMFILATTRYCDVSIIRTVTLVIDPLY